LASLMEPFIIVILGTLIGGIVVSMYLPIFKLGQVVRAAGRTPADAARRDPLLALDPGRSRPVHRQLPERRHPPPPADAGARLARRKRRVARRGAPRTRATPALDTALALPVLRPRHRLVRERPARELALAARPLLGLHDAHLRPLSRGRRGHGRCLRGDRLALRCPADVAALVRIRRGAGRGGAD